MALSRASLDGGSMNLKRLGSMLFPVTQCLCLLGFKVENLKP